MWGGPKQTTRPRFRDAEPPLSELPTDEARERADEDEDERDTIPAPPWADEPIETDDSDVN